MEIEEIDREIEHRQEQLRAIEKDHEEWKRGARKAGAIPDEGWWDNHHHLQIQGIHAEISLLRTNKMVKEK